MPLSYLTGLQEDFFKRNNYKFAKNNHQEKNAKWLIDKKAGEMLLEDKLTEEKNKAVGGTCISLSHVSF